MKPTQRVCLPNLPILSRIVYYIHSKREKKKGENGCTALKKYFGAFRDFHELAKGLGKIIAALQLRPRRSASGGLFYEMQYSKEANELRKTPSCSILELLTFRLRLTLNNSTSAFY